MRIQRIENINTSANVLYNKTKCKPNDNNKTSYQRVLALSRCVVIIIILIFFIKTYLKLVRGEGRRGKGVVYVSDMCTEVKRRKMSKTQNYLKMIDSIPKKILHFV